MMEVQSLRTFQAVVEEGGILSASRKLNTVQSNVTTRIKHLEQEIGTELFYRKGRGLELAPPGKVLLNYARQILQLESQARIAVRQVGEQSGELRIGSMESFAALHLPKALKLLRQLYQKLDFHIETNTSMDLIEKVLDHKLDCAFVGGPVDHPELVTTEISMEELVLVKSRNTHSELLPLILFREGCTYRARALMWHRKHGQHVNKVMEMGTLDGLMGCVSVGLGCTLMPEKVLHQSPYKDDLVSEKIEPEIAMVPTLLIRQRNALPLKALDTMIETAANIVNQSRTAA